MIDIYSYEDYAIDDHNAQLPLRIDVRAQLRKLGENIDSQNSLPAFARDVTNVLNNLYDGHTVLAPECSGRVSYDAFLPLAFLGSGNNSSGRVYVHPEYDQFLLDRKINQTVQFDLHRSLAGAEVVKIDDQDVFTYLSDLTNNPDVLYGNIDPQTRWNQLFVNLRGHPTPRLGYGVALTSLSRAYVASDVLKLDLLFNNRSRAHVQLPWLGSVDTDYQKIATKMSFQDYYTQYICLNGNSTELLRSGNASTPRSRAVLLDRDGVQQDSVFGSRRKQYLFDQEYELVRDAPSPDTSSEYRERRVGELKEMLPSSKTTAPNSSSQLELLANIDSGLQIYHFKNTSVGVLFYTNFDGAEKEHNSTRSSDTFAMRYVKEMARGLQELKARGVDTLLIEVSGNNGGRTELGSLAMLSLFPTRYPGFATVLRSNPEMMSFLDGSDYHESFCRPDGSRFKSVNDWFAKDNSTILINGVNSSYTQLSVDNLIDNENWPLIGNATFPTSDLFLPKNMMIVSNGKCASTCAQVAMYYQDVHGVRSAGFGGMPKSAHLLQTVGGVRGAQVVDMLNEDDPSENMYNFTMKVTQMTINFRSAIHYERKIPTEYVTRNVDYSYQHTRETYNSFEKTWRFVAEMHFADAMRRQPVARKIEAWKPLRAYPAGWFTGLQALDSAMTSQSETNFFQS